MRRTAPHLILVLLIVIGGAAAWLGTSVTRGQRMAQPTFHPTAAWLHATRTGSLLWTESRGTDRAPGYLVMGHPDSTSKVILAATSAGADVVAFDGYVYWANFHSGTIGRARINGTGVDPRFIVGASNPVGIAVTSEFVYWTNSFQGTIGRADIDGRHVNQSFIRIDPERGLRTDTMIDGLAVYGNSIYWTSVTAGDIGRADLDGRHIERTFITGANRPIAVTVAAPFIFWSNSGAGTIGRANLMTMSVDQHCVEVSDVPVGNVQEDVVADGKWLYFTNYPADTIGRSNLIGTRIDAHLLATTEIPEGIAVVGDNETSAGVAGSCAASTPPVVLGEALRTGFAAGWGEAAPPYISYGGAAPTNNITGITWTSWGSRSAYGHGHTPTQTPRTLQWHSVLIDLQATGLKKCSRSGVVMYTELLQCVPNNLPISNWSRTGREPRFACPDARVQAR